MMTPDPDSAWAILGLVGNHLWQSTVVAAIAGLLVLTVRQARAQVRYWIWLAASVKFVLPFGALVALGSQVSWRTATASPAPNLAFVMDAISQPFAPQAFDAVTTPAPATAGLTAVFPVVLLAIWFSGTALLLLRWLITWRRIAAIVGEGTPVVDGRVCDALLRIEQASGVTAPIRLVSSTTTLEPGVFGIVRPVLLWSRSLAKRLDDDQIDAILAHEVSHVRRHDNLTAALHMVVEALFWFHPLVWWVSARLVEARECACDEAVLALGNDPHVYAQGILTMCEFYVESPLTCLSGVTGPDLKRRIEAIMGEPSKANLTLWRKVLLAMALAVTIAIPIALGVMNPARLQAQTAARSARPSFDVASVKTNISGDDNVDMNPTATGITIHNATLQMILRLAFRVQNDQILNAPVWWTKTRFDVMAKNETPFPSEELRIRLQTLLADRFALRTHKEMRERPIYALVKTNNGRLGPRIHAPSSCVPANTVPDGSPLACSNNVLAGRMSSRGATMWTLAVNLSVFTGRTVFDKTGFMQTFDYDLEWNPESTALGGGPGTASSPSDRPSLFAALQEQLGLKLQSTRGPVDGLVIDHVEQPTPD